MLGVSIQGSCSRSDSINFRLRAQCHFPGHDAKPVLVQRLRINVVVELQC